jgi:hypothetical protein
MHDPEPLPLAREIELNRRSDKVDSPQQYTNWRDYAFSENPEDDAGPRH